eukprot:8610335-Karenia_brevis.AAC.1
MWSERSIICLEIPGQRLQHGERTLLILGVYIVPDSSASKRKWARIEREDIMSALEDMVSMNSAAKDILILGDSNIRVANRADGSDMDLEETGLFEELQ